MKSLNNHSILHNRYLLYILFIIALGNLLILGYENDYYSVSVFILIGFLTSFFSKNMIVIFVMSIAFTAIIKMGLSGSKPSIEGMTTDDTEDEKKSVKEDDVDEENNENDSKKSKSKPEKKSALSVETNDESNKEKFEQEKNVVYTSEEDKELAKTEKMILSQEKI